MHVCSIFQMVCFLGFFHPLSWCFLCLLLSSCFSLRWFFVSAHLCQITSYVRKENLITWLVVNAYHRKTKNAKNIVTHKNASGTISLCLLVYVLAILFLLSSITDTLRKPVCGAMLSLHSSRRTPTSQHHICSAMNR